MSGDDRLSRRRLLTLGAAGLALGGCSRFDGRSWISRERFDVDRRFRESIELFGTPEPAVVDDDAFWSMLIISDLHCWEGEQPQTLGAVGEYLAREPVDLIFQLGDLADAGWPEEFEIGWNVLDSLGPPVYGCMGNHDVFHEGWVSFRRLFGPSVYVLQVGASQVIMMDLAGGTLGGLQRPWLEDQLAAATADHVFLMGHYPLWDPVSMGFSQLGSEQEVYDLLDLMRTYEVDAHFSGHTHRYASTEVDGVKLYTVSSMKESQPDRCVLRVDVAGDQVTYTRIPLGGVG
jgi:predicted phosphodiesterase